MKREYILDKVPMFFPPMY